MPLTRNWTIQEGDSETVVIPVVDSDDPNRNYYPNISSVGVEFTLASDFDAGAAEWVVDETDSAVSFKQFSNTKRGSDSFDFSDVDLTSRHTIPASQDVVVVEIPATQTDGLTPGDEYVYQCRIDDSGDQLTAVKGSITVEDAAPFST